MTSLFGDRSLGQSKREPMTGTTSSRFTASATTNSGLASPFGDLTPTLSATDLRETAYEIFVAACRTCSGKPLTYVPNNSSNAERSPSPSPSSLSSSPSMQRSLTSTAASTVKKALGLRSSLNSGPASKRSDGSPSSGGKAKRPVTVGELMRVQMRVSETTDSRIRRALLRIAAGQVGRRIESMVLPLELLQQSKSSDFADQKEYEAWQRKP